MGFERVAPQVVRHSDGYTVQIGGRYHIEYLAGDAVARIPADLEGPIVRLHSKSIVWVKPHERPATQEERTLILSRVKVGIEAMGDNCEVLDR